MSQSSPSTRQSNRAEHLLAALRDASNPHVFVVAHRGDWRDFPENSLSAIEYAIRMGVDMIETDVRPTRDGRFVILHDKTLDRVTTGTGPVSSFTLDELKQFHLRDALGRPTTEPIPTLEQVLELCRDRVLVYLDKTEDHIPEVFEVVRNAGLSRQVFFYGRRPVAELRDRMGPVLSQVNYIPKVSPSSTDARTYVEEFARQFAPPCFIVEFDEKTEKQALELASKIRELGSRVWVSPIDPGLAGLRTDDNALTRPEGTWGFLIENNVSLLCTDRPRPLLDYLRKLGRHD